MQIMKYEIRKSSNGKFYWVFIARNGEVVCTSQLLKTKQAARKGLRSNKRSRFAPIIDKTLMKG